MVTPAAKREAVAHVRSAFELSERRACRITGCVRMTVRYCSRRTEGTELRERLRALAHERRRFGYRRLHVLLTRSDRFSSRGYRGTRTARLQLDLRRTHVDVGTGVEISSGGSSVRAPAFAILSPQRP